MVDAIAAASQYEVSSLGRQVGSYLADSKLFSAHYTPTTLEPGELAGNIAVEISLLKK